MDDRNAGCFERTSITFVSCNLSGLIHTGRDARGEANKDAQILVVTTVLFTLHLLSNACVKMGPGSILLHHASRAASSVDEASNVNVNATHIYLQN